MNYDSEYALVELNKARHQELLNEAANHRLATLKPVNTIRRQIQKRRRNRNR